MLLISWLNVISSLVVSKKQKRSKDNLVYSLPNAHRRATYSNLIGVLKAEHKQEESDRYQKMADSLKGDLKSEGTRRRMPMMQKWQSFSYRENGT
jgi:hypothetical protein